VRKPPKRIWWPVDQEPLERPAGFPVPPRRWVVARTFAWLGRSHWLRKDDEVLHATEDAWISLAMSRLMTVRLTQ